jgi:hypothetical protein
MNEQLSAHHQPDVQSKPRFLRQGVPFTLLVAGILTLIILTLPSPAPDNSVDSSLGAVLHYAASHGLQHSQNIVFTYGPLGYLMFFYYSPHLADLRMGVDLALCFTVAMGVCLLAWKLSWPRRWGLLILFVWFTPNLQSRADFVMNIGLCCWGLLCFVESGRRLRLAALALVCVSAFCALAKLSFLVSATMLLILLAIDLALRFRWRLAAAVVLGYVGLFMLGWLVLGQKIGLLPCFLRNSVSIVQAYNQGEEQKKRFKEIRDLVETNGGKLRVMTFPFLHALGANYPFRSVHAQLDTAWRELGVPHLDLLETFSGFTPQALTVNPHDAHPNELAHRLAADALNKWSLP